MKKLIYIALVILSVTNVSSQELKKEYQNFIQTFIDNVKGDKKEVIANMISYPLKRDTPIPEIKNKTEFIKRYSEIFDSDLKKEITSSKPDKDWSEMGWRGIMLNQGSLWIDTNGKIIAINHQSKFESDLKNKLIIGEKSKVHSSIAKFKEPVCVLETSKFRIRIDDMGNNKYRYASWSIKKKMTEKPDLIITNGKFIADGTGGNHSYEFKKSNYVYQCFIIVLGEKDAPPAKLVITQSTKTILSQDARIVPR